jgi:EAL domain-containing protein (putative c-di-GMP-specific phosphodiesterase class I)
MDFEGLGYQQLDDASKAFIARALAAARDYLGARVSFLAEVVGSDKVIRAADGPADAARLAPGTRFDLEDSYCYRVLSGRIPQAIYDARTNPVSCDIPLTAVLGIDSYMGVPVQLRDGRAFGTLCCVNFDPHPEASARDLGFMTFLADLIGRQLESAVLTLDLRRQRRASLRAVLAAGGPVIRFHPIVELATRRLVGVEALSRFDVEHLSPPPDLWFREAWAMGMGPETELAAINGALWALEALPEGVWLSINVSPAVVTDPRFAAVVADVPPGRVVVEVTEHAPVDDYAALAGTVRDLASRGIRVAIDDVGAGYSSLRHVLEIGPQVLKLDVALVQGIDGDPARQAMAAGVMAFAQRTGALVIAEGVQTEAEAHALMAAGIPLGQGYLYGQPDALATALDSTASVRVS